MNEIITRDLIRSLKSSVALPVHDPISFGFDEMVKAKADSVKVKQELADIGKVFRGVSDSDETLTDTARSKYIYDYNVVAELSEIKRRKNRR